MNIIEELQRLHPELSPRMRKLATYIADHHKEAAFLNAGTLAREAGVSEATVTRLACALGLKGYPGLRQALQTHAKGFMALPKYENGLDDKFLLSKVASVEKSIIDEMLLSISPKLFQQAVDKLHAARSITVVGTRYNQMAAAYAAYFLNCIRPSVRLVSGIGAETFTELRESGPKDVALAVCTARYPRETLKILSMFRERQTPVIAITDSQLSPVQPLADLSLIVPMKFLSYIDPLGGVMILLHALVTGLYLKNPAKTKARLKDYNEFMEKNDFHSVKGLDIGDML
ncbi:MAG: MurR/RpiR family transcriptional regulator [Candidatus Adiutrix sp.]|jgi:DNA-binding MurR/RpiR family transcriptional regulator|nr:MurR/RpiR family transcriptional regulator [Candidatus Adiutrix sp.]